MKKMIAVLMIFVLVISGCSANGDDKSVGTLKNNDTVGTGSVSFAFSIVDDKGEQINVTVKTDEKTVGDALEKLKIVAGEEGDYGLYIKTVNGLTADYNKDGKYWAFYVDGKYAEKSASLTEIVPDSVYMLKVEAAS